MICVPNLKESGTFTCRKHSRVYFVLLLLPPLIVAQLQCGYSDNPLTSGVNRVNSCISAATLSDFKADIESLAATITGRTEIQPEFIQRYFSECSLEGAQDLLTKSGFDAGELDPASNNSEMKKGTRRLVLAEKNIRPFNFRDASLNCRFILRISQSNALTVQGFFYFDAP
jgi:hypothetical protein